MALKPYYTNQFTERFSPPPPTVDSNKQYECILLTIQVSQPFKEHGNLHQNRGQQTHVQSPPNFAAQYTYI